MHEGRRSRLGKWCSAPAYSGCEGATHHSPGTYRYVATGCCAAPDNVRGISKDRSCDRDYCQLRVVQRTIRRTLEGVLHDPGPRPAPSRIAAPACLPGETALTGMPVLVDAAYELQDRHQGRHTLIALTAIDSWALVIEPNGYLGVTEVGPCCFERHPLGLAMRRPRRATPATHSPGARPQNSACRSNSTILDTEPAPPRTNSGTSSATPASSFRKNLSSSTTPPPHPPTSPSREHPHAASPHSRTAPEHTLSHGSSEIR